MTVAEAKLEQQDGALVPAEDGWFVLNARDARWFDYDKVGQYCPWESKDARFQQLGINVNVLPPGAPMAMYHAEDAQEDFLVVAGEALLIVDGEERPLRQWDLVHCPPNVAHVVIGAGDEPCVIVAVGARNGKGGLVYPVSETAIAHEAGVSKATTEPREAYEGFPEPKIGPAPLGVLPDL